jgi:acetyl-CoA carboxylase carboxyltransferase component
VGIAYERGRALNMAQLLELDAVIDPADTRAYIERGLESVPPPAPRRRFIDTW